MKKFFNLFKRKKTITKIGGNVFYKFDNDKPILLGNIPKGENLKLTINTEMIFTSNDGKKQFIIYLEKI